MTSSKSLLPLIVLWFVPAILSFAVRDQKIVLREDRAIDIQRNWAQFLSKKSSYFIKLWPEGVVKYRLSPDFLGKEVKKIQRAMKEIEGNSCVKFAPSSDDGRRTLLIIRKSHGDRCVTIASPRNRTNPVMKLDPFWCLEHGRILHELMHALGFTHEHQRPDRDFYVKIMWKNIKEEHKPQFRKLDYPMSKVHGFPYDYASILHYSSISSHAAINPSKPVMLPRRSAPFMGQRMKLDEIDVLKINILYECKNYRPIARVK